MQHHNTSTSRRVWQESGHASLCLLGVELRRKTGLFGRKLGTSSKARVTRGPLGMQEETVIVSQDVRFALPVMRTLMARLRVVVRHRGDLGLGVLHHWLNLWPS